MRIRVKQVIQFWQTCSYDEIQSNYFLWLPTDNSKAERRLEKNPNISLNRSPTAVTDESDQSDVMLLCEGFKYQRHLTIEFLLRARTRFFDQLNTKALHQLRANQPVGGCVMSFLTIPTIAAVAAPLVTRNLWASALQKNSSLVKTSLLCNMQSPGVQNAFMSKQNHSTGHCSQSHFTFFCSWNEEFLV